MFKSILIATDGSPLSDKVVADTLALARTLGARVTAVTVEAPYKIMEAYRQGVSNVAAAIELQQLHAHAHSEKVLAAVAEAARSAGVECELVHVEHEHPWEAIIATALERGCDLIAMASHGRSGIQAVLVGSETQKVLTHSKVPVLVYR